MPDREKVIKGLQYCTHTDGTECPNCPYLHEDDCVKTLGDDALAMLKEQEATIKAQQFVLNNACEKLKEQKMAMKPKCVGVLHKDALELLKQIKGLTLALEQSNAVNEHLNAEVERMNTVEHALDVLRANGWKEKRNEKF